MSHEYDISFLNRQELLQHLFPVAYSPYQRIMGSDEIQPAQAKRSIEVEKGINIINGFWPYHKEAPTVLLFHGNGETVPDYAFISQFYNQRKINLFVADYRGYALSNGKPDLTSMLADSHKIYHSVKEIIGDEGYLPSLFVMGRSLGSIPAIEVAFHHQDGIKGLIVESGTASNFRYLWEQMVHGENNENAALSFLNSTKIAFIRIPTLIIHGDLDRIIPVEEGQELYDRSGSYDRHLVIIPRSGHNDLLLNELDMYFSTINTFVRKHTG